MEGAGSPPALPATTRFQDAKMTTWGSYLSAALLYAGACVWAASTGQELTALGLVVVALLTVAILGLAHLLAPPT